MSAHSALSPDEYETQLRSYYCEIAEEVRAVRVGEKDVSEQAAIVGVYARLFTREQLESLREAQYAATGDHAERLYRLCHSCESGLVLSELAHAQDALVNAELGIQIAFRGETLPVRSAKSRVAVLAEYSDREALGVAAWDASAGLNDQRRDLLQAAEDLKRELSGTSDAVARSQSEKGISLAVLADAVARVLAMTEVSFDTLRGRWFDRVLGAEREPQPSSYHAAYLLRLSPLARVFKKDMATAVSVATLEELGLALDEHPNIHADLEDRPQKSPRPCVIAPDPPKVVHLITRAQGGLQDFQGLLHEAGHALHYAGCDPNLPYAFRALSRDNALSEIYAFVCEAVSREPEWHARYFAVSDEEAADHAEATRFLHAFLVRRYASKLRFELEFWSRFDDDGATADGYAEGLTAATGLRYRPDAYLSDLDSDFYSADYLRGWVRAAQVRAYLMGTVGLDWWCRPETGGFLSGLFREGTRPSNEDIAERIGFDPEDTGPLVAELSGS